MWLEAVITHDDLVQVVKKLLPVKIYLDEEPAPNEEGKSTERDRWLVLNPATQVALVVDEGLRVTCSAELKWAIAGMGPTLNLDALQVMLRPRIVETSDGHALEFTLEVEEADFHVLPVFIDATIARAVNTALATRKLSWNFTKTLSRKVSFGHVFDRVEALDIEVALGKLRIDAEALALVVSFEVGFVRAD
jgi:hypothetical protein